MRHHPRFERSCDVYLRILERSDLQKALLKDISNGGLFVEVAAPPAYGLVVHVTIETQSGPLELPAKVVHVLDPSTAETYGRTAGVGLEFEGLSATQRAQLETFVDALAVGFDGEAPARIVPDPNAPAAIRVATRVLDHCERDDLYGALGVEPTVALHALHDAIEETLIVLAPDNDVAPALVARIGHARSLAKRVAVLMRDDDRRLHYDFRHGYLHPTTRLAQASAQEVERLRRVWHRVFHAALNVAVGHAKNALRAEARADFTSALELGQMALESDPFNLALRAAVERWAHRAA
ncbi:MAG: PilZ domain-containing protein [Deltaproteobacteria bacterium]